MNPLFTNPPRKPSLTRGPTVQHDARRDELIELFIEELSLTLEQTERCRVRRSYLARSSWSARGSAPS